ncbi:DUF3991 and toprim domain-containing protein [Ruminococcaceae bacterium OttesenSCG-928-I18]|nr:DUF3991 and toprim domain-containing protein [Ruminococcaceae bacterium OttesenSCG-928-I18]
MPYIPFTEEQKLMAASVDLPTFLKKQGIGLKKSGHEYRLEDDPYITIKGNKWFDQAEQRGGNAISFARRLFGLSFPEAVTMLLDGDVPSVLDISDCAVPKEKKKFELPTKYPNMRRVFAYLIKQRKIPSELIAYFAKRRMLYESAELCPKNGKVYHNAVFVGYDINGIPRHAHKRGLTNIGAAFRGNVEGSDPAYSFHHVGSSENLYVFEAPIDMMSFIALTSDDWMHHNYVALCGVADHAMKQMLETNPSIKTVTLCLDNDDRGIQATGRLRAVLHLQESINVNILLPKGKDWNEDLQMVAEFENIAASNQTHHEMQICE